MYCCNYFNNYLIINPRNNESVKQVYRDMYERKYAIMRIKSGTEFKGR